MKSGHRYIIYFFIFIILIIGLALLVWRNEAFDILHENSGIYETGLLAGANSAEDQNALDTDIFSNTKFIVLKKNFTNFDFNSICRNMAEKKEARTGASDPSAAELSASFVCSLGNGAPFTAPVKKP